MTHDTETTPEQRRSLDMDIVKGLSDAAFKACTHDPVADYHRIMGMAMLRSAHRQEVILEDILSELQLISSQQT